MIFYSLKLIWIYNTPTGKDIILKRSGFPIFDGCPKYDKKVTERNPGHHFHH